MVLLIHCTHHKSGTKWFNSILSSFCKQSEIPYQYCKQNELLSTDTAFWFQHNSNVNFHSIKCEYKCSHMIRDPRDVLVSGYFYHKWTEEDWCRERQDEFNGLSYQEMINSLDIEKGLLFELNNAAKWNYTNMMKWNYNKPNIYEIKYEDFICGDSSLFKELYDFYGLPNKHLNLFLEIVKQNSFENKTRRNLGELKVNNHLRQGRPGNWRYYFTPKVKYEFKSRYNAFLLFLGYESNPKW